MASFLKCLSFLLLLVAGVSSNTPTRKTYLEAHLEHFTNLRPPSVIQNKPLIEARTYIKEQFQRYGLELHVNTFNTTIVIDQTERTVQGENIIGVAKGPESGDVLLVGVDYGTNNDLAQSPLEDNGAGVAVMLEVARNFMEQTGPKGAFYQDKTVVFVGFDLNTKEFEGYHPGRPGSAHFLEEWLWPFLDRSVDNFAGAIILDSISKFNTELNSQNLPYGFPKAFPDAYERIAADGNRGNFMALFTRGNQANLDLSKSLKRNYNKNRMAQLMRLEELVIEDGATLGSAINMVNHQAHYHFWTFHPQEGRSPLPAFLLSDTDKNRTSNEVCPSPCLANTFLTRTREKVLSLTYNAVTSTLLDLQAVRREGNGSAKTAAAAMPIVVMSLLLAAFVKLFQ